MDTEASGQNDSGIRGDSVDGERCYISIAGTNDWNPFKDLPKKRWWQKGSAFELEMRALGFERLGRDYPFWSTTLTGTFFSGAAHRDWYHGGRVLADFLKPIPYKKRKLIALSHGGNMVPYALEWIDGIHTLITIGTPIRPDMHDRYADAAKRIKVAYHIYDPGTFSDLMRVLGARGSLKSMHHPFSIDCPIAGIGHSDILRKSKHVDTREVIRDILRDGHPMLMRRDGI